MPWLKKASEAPKTDKIWELSDPAYRLYDASLHYCAENLTDGHVPTSRIGALKPKPPTTVQISELVSGRLWHRLPDLNCKSCIELRKKHRAGALPRSGYLVHDFLFYNPSKLEWNESEERFSEIGKKGAAARWSGSTRYGSRDGGGHAESHSVGHGGGHAESHETDGGGHGAAHAPYPVLRTPSSLSDSSSTPTEGPEPEKPDVPKAADRYRDRGTRRGGGLRPIGQTVERVVGRATGGQRG